jgi:hypothetical protein
MNIFAIFATIVNSLKKKKINARMSRRAAGYMVGIYYENSEENQVKPFARKLWFSLSLLILSWT